MSSQYYFILVFMDSNYIVTSSPGIITWYDGLRCDAVPTVIYHHCPQSVQSFSVHTGVGADTLQVIALETGWRGGGYRVGNSPLYLRSVNLIFNLDISTDYHTNTQETQLAKFYGS